MPRDDVRVIENVVDYDEDHKNFVLRLKMSNGYKQEVKARVGAESDFGRGKKHNNSTWERENVRGQGVEGLQSPLKAEDLEKLDKATRDFNQIIRRHTLKEHSKEMEFTPKAEKVYEELNKTRPKKKDKFVQFLAEKGVTYSEAKTEKEVEKRVANEEIREELKERGFDPQLVDSTLTPEENKELLKIKPTPIKEPSRPVRAFVPRRGQAGWFRESKRHAQAASKPRRHIMRHIPTPQKAGMVRGYGNTWYKMR